MFSRVFFSILMVTRRAICSSVIEQDQNMTDFCSGIDYKKYCQPIGDCIAGSHVMCMYYNPSQLMGPHCVDGRMIRLKAEHRKIILDKINGARAEIASGNSTALNDMTLPRGYSMYKVKWDKRLALFAQVWANQCRFARDDQCRATKRFRNPGQILGTYRYSIPDWKPENYKSIPEPTGKQCLTETKVKYAIASSLDVLLVERFWASMDYVMHHSNVRPINNYMLMVYGKVTHVGCGLSAYKDFHWSEDMHYEFYYVELVCNLSAQPSEGEQLYVVNPPNESNGHVTPTCGCPAPEYVETEKCLCILQSDVDKAAEKTPSTEDNDFDDSYEDKFDTEDNNGTTTPTIADGFLDYDFSSDEDPNYTSQKPHTKLGMKGKYGLGGNEKPSVLILPIITIDDAPADLRDLPWKSSSQDKSTNQWFDDLNDIQELQKNLSSFKLISSFGYENSQNTNETVLDDEDFKLNNSLQSYQNNVDLGSDNKTSPNLTALSSRKSSIFTRVAPFNLSSQNYKQPMPTPALNNRKPADSATLNKNLKKFLKEVPKKDLSRLEELFLKFIIKKQSESVDKKNGVSPLPPSSFIRPVKSYNFKDSTSKSDKAKELQYNDRRIRNMVEDTNYINDVIDVKKVVPIKIKERDGVVETEFHFDVPVIRKQSPLVKDKDNDKYHRKTYNSNSVDINLDYRKITNTGKGVNNVRVMTNFRKNPDSKYKYDHEMTDESKLKRTLYLHKEIDKLKDKLKHLHQYAHPNSVMDERFRPVILRPVLSDES